MKEYKYGKNRFYNDVLIHCMSFALLLWLISMIYHKFDCHVTSDNIEEYGSVSKAVVLGVWKIPKQAPLAIYCFPVDSVYYTGTFSYSHSINIKKGDRVSIKYLPSDPRENKMAK